MGDTTQGDDDFTGIHLDERAIRVLAHPLRSRLLSKLRIDGPATATELATEFATNTGATSYHLRALESVGLVTDTGEGAGKRRLWKASTQYHSWTNSAFAGDDDTRTALDWLQRSYIRQFAERAERWLDAAEGWPAEWVDALGLSDTFVTVTPEQLGQLNAELDELAAKYRLIGESDPRARRIHLSMYANPAELNPPEEPV
jgi:DNA-binding transcriptional ArsR family regulator